MGQAVHIRLLVAGSAGLALAWWAVVHAGGPLAIVPGSTVALWLPTGLGLAAVVRLGEGVLPGVALGALAGALTGGHAVVASFLFAAGATLEVAAGARVLRMLGSFQPSLTDVRSVVGLMALGAPVMATIGATVAVAASSLAGAVPRADLAAMWGGWWLSDLIAIVSLGPVALTWASPRSPAAPSRRTGELVALLTLVVVTVLVVLTRSQSQGVAASPLLFAIVPFLLWAAVRHGPRGAAAAAFVSSAVATGCTLAGYGPMALGDSRATIVLLLTFTAVAGASTVVLAAAVASTRNLAATLAAAEARERALLRGMPDYVYRLAPDARVLERHGLATSGDAAAAEVEALVTERAVSEVREHVMAALVRGEVTACELQDARGAPRRTLEARFVPVRDGAVLALLRDVSARRLAAQALRESEERYRTVYAQNPSPILILDDATLGILDANDAALRLYGWTLEELRRMTARDIRPPAEAPAFEAIFLNLGDRPYATTRPWLHRRKDGTTFEVELVSHPVQLEGRRARIVMVTDVSERVRLDREVREAQKMEAIGRLVGGIAHDFNNLLASVVGYSELLLDAVPVTDPAHADIREILTAGRRGTQLTRQLLAFSRQQVLAPRVVDLNHVVERMGKRLEPTLGDHIRLELDLCDGPARVKADPALLEQVVTNLVTNARDAMPRGGHLTLATAVEEVEPGAALGRPDASPGEYSVLRVTDTGVGMDAETKRRMFEPFFTTKPLGHGAGLGLAAVYGFVTQLGGFAEVESAQGAGTTVSLFVPRLDTDLPSGVIVQPGAMPFAGNETVLCVEPEPGVSRLVRRALTERGYTVLLASTEAEALALARRHEGAIDLALLDVTIALPEGRDVEQRLRSLRPNLRLVYVTGYGGNGNGGTPQGAPLLTKPFGPETLARTVRGTLDT